MASIEASRELAPQPRPGPRSGVGVWWRRLLADQMLEKVSSIIRVRQYELESLIEDAKRTQIETTELDGRLRRARQLVVEAVPNDRTGARELLDRLDSALPLIADDERLRLMLEAELERNETILSDAARRRAQQLLAMTDDGVEHRRQLESLVSGAVRERNDRVREAEITGELRQNYLTWLGSVLLLLLVGVAGFSLLAAHSGLWAQIVLALLAGALGGTLSGVIRLRVPEARLTTLKNLGPVMLVQPLVGAVGGVVLFAIWSSGLLTVAGLPKHMWSSVAVVAFAGGFSERFFLRSLARITGASDSASVQPHDRNERPAEAAR